MLLLFVRDGCGFSKRVIAAAGEMNINLTLRNIVDEENERVLMEHGKKHQTPYLIDEERAESLYGSDEIIAYLREHYAHA